MGDTKNKSCPISGVIYSGIGGQAVMEGVMMRNKDDYAVAVRRSDGEIVVKKEVYKGVVKSKAPYKIPIIRGILSFLDSLILGFTTINFASDIYMQDAEKEDKDEGEAKEQEEAKTETAESEKSDGNGFLTVIVTVVALILALGLFMVLPYLISIPFSKLVGDGIALSLIEGVIRILIFVGYIKLISLMEDIKRVFMYHGAEHKCINCLEAGMPLTVENVKRSSREHRRCGTSFLLYVMVISIIFFALIRTDILVLKVVLRLVLIPLIAGVSYEFIRLSGRSENALVKILGKPGMWMQRLTTREPDEDMIRVGIRSVEEVFDWKAFLEENFDYEI